MKSLSANQLDAFQEFINIGVGRAASILNDMLESRISLKIPVIEVFDTAQLQQKLEKRFNGGSFSTVRLGFSGQFSGTAELLFPTESAATLICVLTGESPDSPDLDSVKIGTLSEVGNIVINGVMGSISNLLGQHLNYAIPIYLEDTIQNLFLSSRNGLNQTIFILAQTRFEIEELEIIGDIILIFEVSSFDALIKAIDQELGMPL
ncbi:chemotaxis protein CheC [aff. Roholtiella sp. LEGE 12411]|uniref:chemotaxis protein CheC n=1 Tax=aff. Roholtiella sp. LEGE 12411 TaxID=1828822 RepID=UPI0018830AD9|nr:chemotaxis protein CheC [aff. Roholtiella sp. LEGE 12411]MBE9036226.1 chemotaxis protein CheC [aff. Roholtiella sp. LEGE 12411]